jgi:hypothetical protein
VGKSRVVSVEPINDYITIQPALDFFDNEAILAVGAKWLYTYEDGNIAFETRPYCILSNGDKFGYSKKELAKRCLFHVGSLDIPETRWDFTDIEAFSQDPTSKTFLETYSLIRELFEDYMDFEDERLYSLFVCFLIYTYFYPLFNHAPVLQLWGEFKTGKTKVCSLVEAIVFNPINSANISSASVFRLIESRRAIILLDESEDLLTAERARDIRNMLLAGTGKSGETFRQERGSFESFRTQSFRVFSPKLIANIAGIDLPALQSRTIRAAMTGTANKKKANKVVVLEDKKWGEMRSVLYRLCLTRYKDVIEIRDNFPKTNLSGRALGIWQGILTIAHLVEDEVFQELLTYARDNELETKSDIEEFTEEPRAMLTRLVELTEDKEMVYKTPDELIAYLGLAFNLTSKKDLAIRLGRLGLRSRVLYLNNHYARYYNINKSRIQGLLERSQ